MANHVEVLEHGSERLWILLGRFFCDRAVIKEMAGPLFSGPGVVWFVALERGEVIGFCSLRVATHAYWHDYAYVIPSSRGKGVFEKLAKHRDKYLASLKPLPSKVAVPKPRWSRYKRRGWKVDSERGSWVYASREASK